MRLITNPIAWLLVLSLGACGKAESPERPAAASAGATQSKDVALNEASRQFIKVEALAPSVPASGSSLFGRTAFRPKALSSVTAPFAGRIASVAIEPGREVRAGAELFTIQSADVAGLRANLEQARLRVRIAEEGLARQTEMVKRGVGLELERLEAEFKAREARAELERSEKSAALAGDGSGTGVVVRAPVDGVVVAVRAAPGSTVQPGGDPLVEIGNLAGIWVVADVPEREAALVKPGLGAEITIPALDLAFPGRVAGIAPRSDPETRRTPVYIDVKGAPSSLRAGMLARVALASAGGEAGLWLPVTAVLMKEGRRVVYIETPEGKFVPRDVVTGDERAGRVRILKGLQEGERVVMRGALLVDREAEQLL